MLRIETQAITTVSDQETLKAALELGGDVQLENDITLDNPLTILEGKTVNLDLNGKTINVTSSFSGRPLINKGTLKVFGNGVIDSSVAESKSFGAIDNYGKLTVVDGSYLAHYEGAGSNIRNKGGDIEIYSGYFKGFGAVNNENGKIIIHNGYFEGASCSSCPPKEYPKNYIYAVRSIGNNAELNFKSGTVIGTQGALAIAGGTATIENGTFSAVNCSNCGKGSFYGLYLGAAVEDEQTELVINGGTFTSARQVAFLVHYPESIATINGGTFNGNGVSSVGILEDGNLAIKGGLFFNNGAVADVSNWITSGYASTSDGEVLPIDTTGITLNKEKANLNIGDLFKLDATIAPVKVIKSNVSWSTSNENVATVGKDGEVRALGTGEAIITATTENGLTAQCKVVVKVKEIEVVETLPSQPSPSNPVGMGNSMDKEVLKESANEALGNIIASSTADEVRDLVDEKTYDLVLETLSNKEEISVVVKSKIVDYEDVKADAKLIDSYLADKLDGAFVANYLDLRVLLVAGKTELGELHKLNEEISFTIIIPEELLFEGREYYVIRVHNGVVAKLPVTDNGNGTLTFKTKLFSTYALAYQDEAKTPEKPSKDGEKDAGDNGINNGVDTADSTSKSPFIMLLVLSGFILIRKVKREEKV